MGEVSSGRPADASRSSRAAPRPANRPALYSAWPMRGSSAHSRMQLGEHLAMPLEHLPRDPHERFALGALGRIFGARIARHQLERLFAYRHEVTRVTCLAMAGRS